MASLGNNLKVAFLRGLEAVGRGASNMASNAHQKLNEINLETRRRELLSADELSEAPADELPAGEEAADEMEQEQAPAPVVPDPIDEGETGGNA